MVLQWWLYDINSLEGELSCQPSAGTWDGAVSPRQAGQAGPLEGFLFSFCFCPSLLQPELPGQRRIPSGGPGSSGGGGGVGGVGA